ncbi:MAG TPA: VWA domain-containing protein [Candidatus Angelobacter sp.]|jgi:VWFA-related protein|nr:VWA domain-containing protein [Candidatus Angelobacter sp.]
MKSRKYLFRLTPSFGSSPCLRASVVGFGVSFLLAAILVSTLTAQNQNQKQQSSQQRVFTFKTETELVLVNVVAHDKQGNLVQDLKREDFIILEDGKPQIVSSFDYEHIDSAPLPSISGPAQQSITGQPVPSKPILTVKDADEALSNKRIIVLFFDLSSMNPDEIQRSVDAARKYVETKMTSADMIAIVSLASSLRLDQDFTPDRAQLLKVLNRFSRAEGQGMDNGLTGDADGIEETGNAYTPDETEYNQFNTDRKLEALQSLSQVLARFNQKKSIIYFSSGVTQTGIENQTALRAAINTAVKANVSIYTMDSRGLEAQPPGGSAQTASLRGTAMYSGSAVQSSLDKNFASQETLTTLAGDTGGKAFLDTNDLGQVFDRVQRDTSVYYVLGYKSSNPLRDGHYRRIEVKVNHPALKLEFRKGYYAPKDFKHFNAEDKDRQMQDELASDLPSTDVAVYMAAAYFRLDENRFYTPVSLVVPGSQIPFTKGGDKDKAALDVIGQVLDELKRSVGSVRETVRLSLDASQEVKRKNVQYTTGFVLGPGKYHFKFVVRENESGRIGSFETDFTIPDIRKAPLKMSSVVLASQRKDNPKKGQNPLVRDGSEIIPNIAHVFTPDQHLFFFYEVYEPTKDKSPSPNPGAASANDKAESKEKSPAIKNPIHLLTSIQFFNGKIKAFETPLVEARQLNAPERKAAVFQFDIPLTQLKPGFYTCQVSVIDDVGGSFSFPRLPLLVREKAGSSPSATTASPAGGAN